MSSHHQVTVPRAVASASSIKPGDRFRVESDGKGRFVMTRIDEYRERYSDQLSLAEDVDAHLEVADLERRGWVGQRHPGPVGPDASPPIVNP
jgi:bifunctional DNA-binding transcriptional regulator/antitoxin component of YhaV-PrlF toxin-antitoxin module